MPVAERTYSFRAPGELGERIREASAILDQIGEVADPEFAQRLGDELVLAIVRDSARFREMQGNQSAFLRETVELLVTAAKKVASDLQYADLYAEAASDQNADEVEFRNAGRARAARRWRDA
jgi:hypothetical protein